MSYRKRFYSSFCCYNEGSLMVKEREPFFGVEPAGEG